MKRKKELVCNWCVFHINKIGEDGALCGHIISIVHRPTPTSWMIDLRQPTENAMECFLGVSIL
jgi:hypothetical protein